MAPSNASAKLVWLQVDVGEILVMADDVATPSNPLITPVEHEKPKETLFDVNVS
jgi:hypothetical protein